MLVVSLDMLPSNASAGTLTSLPNINKLGDRRVLSFGVARSISSCQTTQIHVPVRLFPFEVRLDHAKKGLFILPVCPLAFGFATDVLTLIGTSLVAVQIMTPNASYDLIKNYRCTCCCLHAGHISAYFVK